MAHLDANVSIQLSIDQRLVYIALNQHGHIVYFEDSHLDKVNGLIYWLGVYALENLVELGLTEQEDLLLQQLDFLI